MKKKISCPNCNGNGFISKWSDYIAGRGRCNECNGTGEIEVPFTIGDRIRSMSDEEIAAWVSEHGVDIMCELICGRECKAVATLDKTSNEVCQDIVKEQLAKEWY